jgi:phosphocarrier protein HPr
MTGDDGSEDNGSGEGDTLRRIITICNKRGLHARAAARFVQLAWEFDAESQVAKKGAAVSGRSIMGLMMLAAGTGTEIELRTSGPQAESAMTALAQLIADGFDEE